MKDDIKQWIKKGRKYADGVALYSKYGRNKNLIRTFSKKQNSYNSRKLGYELQKLLDAAPASEVVARVVSRKKVVKKAEPSPQTNHSSFPTRFSTLKVDPEVDVASLPDELKYEYHQRIALYKEANVLHLKLVHGHFGRESAQTKSACEKILANFELIDLYWYRLDYFKEHGIVPPAQSAKPSVDKKSAFEVAERLKNQVRPQISKLKRKLALKPMSANRSDWEQKLARLCLERDSLENSLRSI